MSIKLFQTATLTEAKPIIDRYDLKLYEKKPFSIYKNENLALIISKIGKIDASIAASYAFCKFEISKIINIGICSCKNEKDLYKMFRIKSVIDKASDKKISLKIKNSIFMKASLTTFDKEALHNAISPSPLIDMEAYGFLKASMKFTKIENIYIYKVASDLLENKIPKKDEVYAMIEKFLPDIEIEI